MARLLLLAAVAATALALPSGASAQSQPRFPRITQLRVEINSPSDPVVRAVINPGGSTTRWHVLYGLTPELGQATSEEELAAGTEDVLVRATLPGLPPARRIYWRVVATNERGTRTSRQLRFTTLRAPTGVSLAVEPAIVPYGDAVAAHGQVLGSGVAGTTVALMREPFPFGVPFEMGTVSADPAGAFAFDGGPLLVTTRFRAETRTAALAQSPVVTVYAAVRVQTAVGRPTRRDVPVAGSVEPLVSNGVALLQRLGGDGRWRTVRRARVTDAVTESRYRLRAPRLLRARLYRVAVDPRDGGAHVPAAAPTFEVGARVRPPTRRRRRPAPKPPATAGEAHATVRPVLGLG
jgi:hypothetical protein